MTYVFSAPPPPQSCECCETRDFTFMQNPSQQKASNEWDGT